MESSETAHSYEPRGKARCEMSIVLVVTVLLAVIATVVGLMLYGDKRELHRLKDLDRVD